MVHFSVIVLGGGTMGSAAAWALGKRGVRSLVLEQFRHVHTMGSHGGKTRIIRHAYAESPDYVPLVQRADRLWQELEAEAGDRILYRSGGLDLAAPGFHHARDARTSAERFGLPFDWLDGTEVRRRWPVWKVSDDWEACYSPQAGYLAVEPGLHALAAGARQHGVTISEEETVLHWHADGAGVQVETDRAVYTAERLIITAGPWSGRLLAELGLPLTVLRKTLWWFELDDPAPFAADRFPVFITESEAGEIYGFPADQSGRLKVAAHSGGEPADPHTVDRETRRGEHQDVLKTAQRVLQGVSNRVAESSVCLYTMTPDTDFIVDRLPDSPQVVVGAGFSGHGFKFATAIGEQLAALALDPAETPLPRLALSRLLALD
ncbi:MAG: N-methyl-L-tryptophan oxidase [Chloroflexota bacterium]|nr:N-methyl-L-tryptophan oxidase [Chloroflexota bacterium]